MNYLGMNKEKLRATADELNRLLANYHVYYQNLRNVHWNIAGENFFDLHEQFEELYDDAKEKIDDIAERILTLRFRPMSQMSEYLARADVEEAGYLDSDRKMVDMVLNNHKLIIANMRQVLDSADNVGDEGTIDMVGGFLADLEKRSWMFDAWKARVLEGQPA
jgi:starvation-inducible DNA-binding protein